MEEEKKTNKAGNKRGTKAVNPNNFANNPELASEAGKKPKPTESCVVQSMKQQLTEGRHRRITPEIQQEIRDALTIPDKKGHTYMQDFIAAFLKEAKENPSSNAGRMLASAMFNENLLSTLDAEVDKQMAKEIEFVEYRLRQTLFDKQQEFYDCKDKLIITIAGRRAGKTESICRILLKRCLKPESHCLYMNLNFTNALNQCYDKVLDLAKEYDIQIKSKSRADGIIEFHNGSFIMFRGNSTIIDAEKTRGYSWHICIIDEIGSQKNLNYLIYDCIMPATKDYKDSQIILTGTPPRVPHHTSEIIWNNPEWTHFHWDFRNNPHIPDKESVIPDMCKAKGITPDSSLIKIEMLGLVGEYDTDAMVYRGYHTYDKLPTEFKPSIIYIGVDPGFNDYTGIVALACDKLLKKAYVIEEYKFNKCGIGEIANKIKEIRERLVQKYNGIRLYTIVDTNEKNLNWSLAQEFHIPDVYTAYKYDKEASISQLAELMRTEVLFIPKGGPCEDEAQSVVYKRDPDTDVILNEIDDDVFHPDILDALRYASRQFVWDIWQKGKDVTTKDLLEGARNEYN